MSSRIKLVEINSSSNILFHRIISNARGRKARSIHCKSIADNLAYQGPNKLLISGIWYFRINCIVVFDFLYIFSISLQSVPLCLFGNTWALVPIMAVCWIGNNPLPEIKMTQLSDVYRRHQFTIPSQFFINEAQHIPATTWYSDKDWCTFKQVMI